MYIIANFFKNQQPTKKCKTPGVLHFLVNFLPEFFLSL